MPVYDHKCRSCTFEWLEDYSLETFDWFKANGRNVPCPECDGEDTFRQLGVIPVHFKGGGWSPDGYYKYGAYDQHVAEGKKVEIYERTEDLDRVMKGERREAMKRRLKAEDRAAKRAFGPDAGIKQADADRRIEEDAARVKDGKVAPKALPSKRVDRNLARQLGGGRER